LGYCQVVKALVFDINIQRFESFYSNVSRYYNKLIVKKKLLNFWTFSGMALKSTFFNNYKFILCFYKKNIFFEHAKCVSTIKAIFPILYSIISNKAKILFAGTNFLYAQSFLTLKTKFISKLTVGNIGSFSNFVIEGFKFFNKQVHKNASLIIFFNVSMNTFLLLESKKIKIPSFGLVTASDNSSFLDYPIFINSFHFHNVYFFSRLVFKYILRVL
jgi:ribosomal protein S2